MATTNARTWLILLAILVVADIASTLYMLSVFPNSGEMNPLNARLLRASPIAFIAVKLLGLLAIFILYLRSGATAGVATSACIQAIIVGINIAGLTLAIIAA
jgi:hypothetical protein